LADPLIILEIYGYPYDRAYTNLFAKAFRLVEERNWKGEFRLLLLFLNSRGTDGGKDNTPPRRFVPSQADLPDATPGFRTFSKACSRWSATSI
jgi:hypothetical protein